MTSASEGPGFFGKVTTHGDFVSRRLPAAPLAVWDAWLQAALQGSREQLGQRWLDTYLTSPIWRFALAPGVCDTNAWAGVLMPSVDRVGRHFPLTIAAAMPGGAAMLDWLAQGKPWYDAVEDLALSSLEEGFVLDDFDMALQGLEPLAESVASPAGFYGAAGFRLPLPGIDALMEGMPQLLGAALHNHSMWWSEGSESVEPCALLCRGLPAPGAFAGMLAGAWTQTGWQMPG